jgi:hypothetical protein
MPENSPPLTKEEHQEMARELRVAEVRLRELCELAVSVYGTNHRVAIGFQNLLDAMIRLRIDLQAQLDRDYPGYDGTGPYV